ncbi:DMT family transporter [Rubricoccus marinus]|uniref:EamA domain-containing protein n=1 Tax=Rubricoccus marinus TaxID=716817 RepID=A0A259U1M3_9BACT|nr:DMT family transporter [Rubricoccus marinus]OZC03943.1 hypothetical protein BSZ36_13705 [Rubricoccus marinus]
MRTSPDPADRLGLSLAALSAATWALAGVWVRLLPGVPLATIVAGRLALALVALAPLAWVWRERLRLTPATWGLATLMVAYYGCAVAAFRFTAVAEGTLFINISPLFAVAWAVARGEAVRRGEAWGTALALAGVAVILAPSALEASGAAQDRLIGDALALLAALGMAAYAISFSRLRGADRAPEPLAVTLLTFGLGAVAALGLWAVQGDAALVGLDSPASWGALIALAVITTAIPTFAYSVASHRLPPILATTVRLLTPAFAAVAAWLVLGEVPSAWLIPGGALVLGGLLLSVRAKAA